jgi:L-fuconolactonase
LCLYATGRLDDVAFIAQTYPGAQLAVDHLGLAPAPSIPAGPTPFAELPAVLALARYENVAMKLTGAPVLSLEPFPFRDLWPHLHRMVEAFGPERLMWGTDWTRATRLVAYDELVRYFTETDELGPTDKELILGQSCRRIFKWLALGAR